MPLYVKEDTSATGSTGAAAGRAISMWWHEGSWNVSADYQPFNLSRCSLKYRGFAAAPDQLPQSHGSGSNSWRQYNVRRAAHRTWGTPIFHTNLPSNSGPAELVQGAAGSA